ncbi:uncharacterized protein LOC110812180 [Carica papaya]|uniref:uncharacterized protein LOC110812180 n=1 Tax=Carica papaya TaxID=3649 RepID=UPI000B8CEF1E|nr:uncharacterized protein LOC110812180 [Carica papaya]
MATPSPSLSLLTFFPSKIYRPKPYVPLYIHNSSSPPNSPISFLPSPIQKKPFNFRTQQTLRVSHFWRISAAAEDVLPPESTATLESSQEIVSTTGDDGVSAVISVLLFAAFVALSILTIGVIYIGVTDYLQKREREKLDKEEAEKKKKKSGKKGKVRARAGPRGFGQKVDDFDDEL